MYFPVSGVEVSPLIPLAVAFVVSFFCSVSGISGAFLLLPWQISFLGYTSPGVSATNQIFNIIACPGGVIRYAREGRLLWPLTLFIVMGTLPGVFIGAVIRLTLLTRNDYFLLFVSLILFYLGWRLAAGKKKSQGNTGKCEILSVSAVGFSFRYAGEVYGAKAMPLFFLSLAVGLAGGIYGVGGGAIMSPFLVSFFNFPVHAIAGASLLATFITSTAGVVFFSCLSYFMEMPKASPDWLLGCILGLGGLIGMYFGASMQKYISAKLLRYVLAATVIIVGITYIFRSLKSLLF